jgi:hypothetical protein
MSNTKTNESGWDVRAQAQQILRKIVKQQPELADTVLSIAKFAVTDASQYVRAEAQWTIQAIVEQRPELADEEAWKLAEKGTGDHYEHVRHAARHALYEIKEARRRPAQRLIKRPDLKILKADP